MSGYILKSINGGGAFSDVTPSSKGPVGDYGLTTYVQDKTIVYALIGTVPTSLDLAKSVNGASSWTIKQSALVSPVSIVCWPYNSAHIYFLTSTTVQYSTDSGENLTDKTGDFTTLSNPTLVDPVAVE